MSGAEPAPGAREAEILAILRAERRPHTPAEIAERTGIPVRTVQRHLGKLVADRDARRAGGGLYAAASAARRRR